MTGITMYDAIADDQFPPGAAAYAAYVDGDLANQPNYSYIVATFPKAQHLSITLFPDRDADALDIENGAATAQSAAAWYERQRKRGIARPCLYAGASTMESDVVPVITAAGISRASVRLWSAHYTQKPHICGPKSCGATSTGMDGTQWTENAVVHGITLDLDQSLLLDSFFGTPSPSPATVEFDMSKLPVLKQGDSDKAGEFWSVRRLQSLLSLTGGLQGIPEAAGLGVDGVFGAATGGAVRALEERYRQQFPQMTVDPAGRESAGAQVWGVLLTGSPA